MTTTTLKATNALPTGECPKNPNNPSPSGDPWYDDPRNVAAVKEAIQSAKGEDGIRLKSKEDITEYFANL